MKKAKKPAAKAIQRAKPVALPEGAIDVKKHAARCATRPSVSAAAVIEAFAKPTVGEQDMTALCDELIEHAKAAQTGDMRRAEAMLMSQAHALQAIFVTLARRSAMNVGEYMSAADTYLRLALKAQAQCRSTLEALAEIKAPRAVAFVKQANIANGPQQVNNGVSVNGVHARTEDSANHSNEQLAVTHEHSERMDPGTTAAAVGSDPAMATMAQRRRT